MAKYIFIFIAATLFACSCSDDETWADSYITNMVEIDTDSNSSATILRLDNGQTFSISNAIRFDRPDTTYRCVCIYTVQGKSATIEDYAKALSAPPVSDTTDLVIKTDPCHVQSIWYSGGYLNVRLQVQGKDKAHKIVLIEQSLAHNPDGSQRLTLLLSHDQNGDLEAFSRNIYLSSPLHNYNLRADRDTVIVNASEQTYQIPLLAISCI